MDNEQLKENENDFQNLENYVKVLESKKDLDDRQFSELEDRIYKSITHRQFSPLKILFPIAFAALSFIFIVAGFNFVPKLLTNFVNTNQNTINNNNNDTTADSDIDSALSSIDKQATGATSDLQTFQTYDSDLSQIKDSY